MGGRGDVAERDQCGQCLVLESWRLESLFRRYEFFSSPQPTKGQIHVATTQVMDETNSIFFPPVLLKLTALMKYTHRHLASP
jgi:hypothetical protein